MRRGRHGPDPHAESIRSAAPARFLICAAVLAALSTGNASPVAGDANGTALCTAANDQLNPVIVSDGASGAIIAWHDNRPTAAAGGVCPRRSIRVRLAPRACPRVSDNGVRSMTAP